MAKVTFITGNPTKAQYLEKLLGFEIDHHKLDLDEIQSLNPNEVVEHKVRQAFELLKRPVLVEDTSLDFQALGRLPGTFIKWFESELGYEGMCRMLDGFEDRTASARGTFGYYDGNQLKIITTALKGTVPEHPRGDKGWGWDPIFIPEGYDQTRAEMSQEDDHATYIKIKPIDQLRDFLKGL